MGARELYGRSRELAIAAEVLARASQGHGGTVVLIGEAGIGKTALASQVADDADALGFRVAWGRCWEAGGAPSYWPWSDVFRSLVGTDVFADAHTELDAPELRFRRFEAARDQLIVRAQTPEDRVAFVVDDLMSLMPPEVFGAVKQWIAAGIPDEDWKDMVRRAPQLA